MNSTKLIAMIPARIGSTRLKMKNLALIAGKPMIAYAIEAAKASGVFDQIILNSDSVIFEKIAQEYGCEFYHRPEKLGSSSTKSDDVVLDFIHQFGGDIVVWVNSTSPLQPAQEIQEAVNYFNENDFDSLITVKNEQVHCVMDNQPVNFSFDGQFAQTQDLAPVQSFVYSLMMWRTDTFQEAMGRQGYAILHGNIGYYQVSKWSGIIIKTEEDLLLADFIARSRKEQNKVTYHPLAPIQHYRSKYIIINGCRT
jgi:CMP-N-acetylneuraminic acid synthetase